MQLHNGGSNVWGLLHNIDRLIHFWYWREAKANKQISGPSRLSSLEYGETMDFSFHVLPSCFIVYTTDRWTQPILFFIVFKQGHYCHSIDICFPTIGDRH